MFVPPRFLQGPVRRPRAAKGGQKDMVNGGRHRNAVQVAASSGRGWKVAGVDDIQVEDVSRRERRWVAGETDRDDTETDGY